MRKLVSILVLFVFSQSAYAFIGGIDDGGFAAATERAVALAYLHRPSAVYDASADKTYIVYQDVEYDIYFTFYDHVTEQGAFPRKLGDGLTADDHGGPTIGLDSAGFIHVFGGSHDSALKHWKSNSANNPNAFTAQSNIGSDLTYPFLINFDSKLWLFIRSGTSQTGEWKYSNEDDFTSFTTLTDATSISGSSYIGGVTANADFIYLTWVWVDTVSDQNRYDVMFAKFDGTTWYKADGVTTYTLPITPTAGEVVVDTSTMTQAWDIAVTTAGVILIQYTNVNKTGLDNGDGFIGTGDVRVAIYSGSWATYKITDANNMVDQGQFKINSTSDFDVYIQDAGVNDGSPATRGGVIKRFGSTNTGQAWASEATISYDSSIQGNDPQLVVDFDADIEVIWTEGNSSPSSVRTWPTDFTYTYNGITHKGVSSGASSR